MDRYFVTGVIALTLLVLGGCTGLPSLVASKDSSHILIGGKVDSNHAVSEAAPAGPKVASLVANLKCELWKAANSKTILPFYKDDPVLETKNHEGVDSSRAYNLRNIFGEIAYIAQATFTLDVVDSSAFNPSAIYTNPIHAAVGLLPATNTVLSVGGTLSEAPHRYIQFSHAIDLNRLVAPGLGPKENANLATEPKGGEKCGKDSQGNPLGGELQGDLGLLETLATGMIAGTMSDISVFQTPGPPQSPIAVSANNTFGLISAQIDFTIVKNINGGANWTLHYLKAPAANNQGLLNFNRQATDKLLITFVPVCIRRKATDKTNENESGPYEYDDPKMVDGTPGWANYLRPCDHPGTPPSVKAQAAAVGQSVNNTLQLVPH